MAIDYGAQTEGIDKLANSLMAQTKERNKVIRNRQKRQRKYQALASIGGYIGNAVLRDRADEFVNNEFNTNSRLKVDSVMRDIAGDSSAYERLQKDPDYYFDQAKQEILEQTGGMFDENGVGVNQKQVEAQITPIARRIANEREALLAQRLKVAGDIDTISGGDPDFYEKELRKLKPTTVGSWLTGLVTGDDDKDLEAIMTKYSPYLESYEKLKEIGVPRVEAAELVELFGEQGLPANIKKEFKNVYVENADGGSYQKTIEVVVNQDTGGIVSTGELGGTLFPNPQNVRGAPKVSPKATNRVTHSASSLLDKDALKVLTEDAKTKGFDPDDASDSKLTIGRNILYSPVVRLQETYQQNYNFPKDFSEQIALYAKVENIKWMKDGNVSLMGDGASDNPILTLMALDAAEESKSNLMQNPQIYQRLRQNVLDKLSSPTIMQRAAADLGEAQTNKLFKYMRGKKVFNVVTDIGTGEYYDNDSEVEKTISDTYYNVARKAAGLGYEPPRASFWDRFLKAGSYKGEEVAPDPDSIMRGQINRSAQQLKDLED